MDMPYLENETLVSMAMVCKHSLTHMQMTFWIFEYLAGCCEEGFSPHPIDMLLEFIVLSFKHLVIKINDT